MTESMNAVDDLRDVFLVIQVCQFEYEDLVGQRADARSVWRGPDTFRSRGKRQRSWGAIFYLWQLDIPHCSEEAIDIVRVLELKYRVLLTNDTVG